MYDYANWLFNIFRCFKGSNRNFFYFKNNFVTKRIFYCCGDEGGFAPEIKNLKDASISSYEPRIGVNYKLGENIFIAIDAASSELFESGMYHLKGENKILSTDELINFGLNLCNEFPIISIEDPFDENDWNGFEKITELLGNKVQIVGDDLFVTNKSRLLSGIQSKAANSILIKLNQIGTLSETIDVKKGRDTYVVSWLENYVNRRCVYF